jgi:hypothetical protein
MKDQPVRRMLSPRTAPWRDCDEDEERVMPPHCDSMDGPVVTAARRALDEDDLAIALPYVPAQAEAEITAAFEQVLPIHATSGSAGQLADRWFFETVVRLHRAGEGAAYTGLKPAGQDEGPVIPVAERAIRTGSADELVRILTEVVADQTKTRLDQAMALKQHEHGPVAAARQYVEAMLGLQVWAHKLYQAATSGPHHGR